jgi:hypothetical protein
MLQIRQIELTILNHGVLQVAGNASVHALDVVLGFSIYRIRFPLLFWVYI